MKNLELYNQKRDFKQTSEPEGKPRESSGKLKFVVQRHAASHLHYDLRLEMEGVLKSWAIPKGPSLNASDKRLAMMTEDHPYEYKDFEGSIPEGNYGAGEMEIWDFGIYEPLNKIKGKSDDLVMRAELHKGSLKFILHGKKLKGEFALVKIKNSEKGNEWLLIKHKDEFSTLEPYDAEEQTAENSKVTEYLNSKKSKKTDRSEETAKAFRNYAPALSGEKKLKKFIEPMLAKSSDKPFDGEDWAFEIKWDGYRAVADLRNEPLLYSRNGLDFSQKFKKVVNQLKLQDFPMVLDGELVAYDNSGKPSFQLLQQIGDKPNILVVFQVFDLLWLNGHSTENLSYLQRKELLKDALKESDLVKYHDHVLENGKDFFRLVENMGLEGMMAKKTDSTYREGLRSSEWLKIKTQQTDEVMICGFTEPKGSRKHFGSLILGKYFGKELKFCGHIGTGFSDKILKELFEKMHPLIQEKSPFKEIPKTNEKPTWLKPELVAEIKFTEITKDGIYRHPVFLRLREDKSVEDLKDISENGDETLQELQRDKEKNSGKMEKIQETETPKVVKKQVVQRENEQKTKIGNQEVKLTNQNKIYWPKDIITKGDLVAYYQSVAEFILPHLKNRPQSLNRFPNGIDGMSFYQKDAADETPDWVKTKKIFSESNEKFINYIICNDAATLAYLNNLGCVEMNVWTSSTENLENPDYLVLDLDPSENNSFDDVIQTALEVKKVLDKAKIEGFPKTSGSSGIHIYIPMNAEYSFEQVKNFGHILMQMVQKELPDLTTLERSLQKRDKNKIYLDYLQNRKGQTLASVYSLRPKNGAPVSMPLEWKELKNGLKPTDFNIENALARIQKKGDLFLPTLGKGIDMLKAIENLNL
ncbi:DNA ligase D [uncultured Chryseobacterium sp.]|uniref:DNA ligase D n=1 Tax=uncultured Chryseobacterium sp. TaxID=259322 RepID=UPI00260F116C|nr:DNA ligase D [uncultured Chryseobacterium sp.]